MAIGSTVRGFISSEPAALIGACGSALFAVVQSSNGHVTWAALYPALLGVVTRFAVSPANSANVTNNNTTNNDTTNTSTGNDVGTT
jgi:hypothetical protein